MPQAPNPSRMKRNLERLIAFKTENPPGKESEAAAFIGNLLSSEGLSVTLDEYKPGRTNIIARLENGGGPVLAFNTHIDVVPAGDGWSSDPFRMVERGGKLYGRGSCDAKGPLVAMIEAIQLLAASQRTWSGSILGVFVADEEVASEGAKHYATTRPKIDLAIIGEPTSNKTVIAHKGSVRPQVRIHGVSAHSGTPDLGENAIYSAARFISLVEEHHRSVVRHRHHPLVGNASLTVTRSNAGVADNVIPSQCDLLLDRRMIPGEDEEAAKAEIAELVTKAKAELNVRAEIVGFNATTGGATETAADHPIVQASLAAGRRHGVEVPGPEGFQGGCDLVHFRTIGAQGTILGPGSLAMAHKPDEFVPADEFVVSSMIYRDIALEMLKVF